MIRAIARLMRRDSGDNGGGGEKKTQINFEFEQVCITICSAIVPLNGRLASVSHEYCVTTLENRAFSARKR